jgi:hypothetical protein
VSAGAVPSWRSTTAKVPLGSSLSLFTPSQRPAATQDSTSLVRHVPQYSEPRLVPVHPTRQRRLSCSVW